MNFYQMAEIAQTSLDYFYRTQDNRQLYHNTYPIENPIEEDRIFNYWWLAHLIDARLDGFLRSQNHTYLQQAQEVYQYAKNRNGNTLIHEYYDDMLWHALALFRFYEITGEAVYLEETMLVWQDIVQSGWNDICGGGFAWKKTQVDYKNTPVNAPFILLSMRLYQLTKEEKYYEWGEKTYRWMLDTLVNPNNGFVEDGINRNGDHQIDFQWKFTYNQGVFIGACLELYKATKDEKYLNQAIQTAKTAMVEFTSPQGNLFVLETQNGDVGLFKGIFYRYAVQLLEICEIPELENFINRSVEILWRNHYENNKFLPGTNWAEKTVGKVDLSTFLSGLIAVETCARLNSQ